jgi:hypothetical protein
MDSLPKVRDLVSWHDERTGRLRFGDVVSVSQNEVRVRGGDGKIKKFRPSEVKAF